MNINCSICQELFTTNSETVIIPCGHIFHFDCLTLWLNNYKSKTCPQCRHPTIKKDMIKVFFNIAEIPIKNDDPTTLQYKLDGAKYELKLNKIEVDKLKNQYKESENVNQGLRSIISELEQQQVNDRGLIAALKTQIRDLKREADIAVKLKTENNTLTQELQLMEDMRKIISDSSNDVTDIIRNYQDARSLAVMVVTLKKELMQQRKKREKSRTIHLSITNELKDLKRNFDAEKEKHKIILKRLEDSERNNELFRRKIAQLERKLKADTNVELDETTINNDGDKILQSPILKRIPLKRKKNLISTLSIESIESPTVPEKIQTIKDSESPYLPIKYSSVGRVTLDADNINPNMKIFKKPRLLNNLDNYQPLPTGAFNSLGGLSETTQFPNARKVFKKKVLQRAKSSTATCTNNSNPSKDQTLLQKYFSK